MLQYTSDQIFNNKSKDQKGSATTSPCNDNADTAVVLITDFGIFLWFLCIVFFSEVQ